eukprot:FR741426.1.p2 GENE.FR741426.1~~FR741426.1.p2  ORF type:complete len:107 (-),score=14.18 FR741426.1:606-926(-)
MAGPPPASVGAAAGLEGSPPFGVDSNARNHASRAASSKDQGAGEFPRCPTPNSRQAIPALVTHTKSKTSPTMNHAETNSNVAVSGLYRFLVTVRRRCFGLGLGSVN